MAIHLIRDRATPEQIGEMLKEYDILIKVAVDVEQEILVGGGEYHADCEEVLLNEGSRQRNIWGANWDARTGAVECEAMLNIRPRDNNFSTAIQDPNICQRVVEITQRRLGTAHG
ncbi:MAG: DUF5674 family protein [Chloroflexota bacterium]